MVVFALLLTLLSFTLAWFARELFRGNPFDPRGVDAEPSDQLGSLRAVVVVSLVLSLTSAVYLWVDRVWQYSEQDLGELLSQAADDLEETGGTEQFEIEEAIGAHGDAWRVRVVSASSDDFDVDRWVVTDDDGGSPHCLVVRNRGPEEDRSVGVYAGYC
jgi:hypothetical protein